MYSQLEWDILHYVPTRAFIHLPMIPHEWYDFVLIVVLFLLITNQDVNVGSEISKYKYLSISDWINSSICFQIAAMRSAKTIFPL